MPTLPKTAEYIVRGAEGQGVGALGDRWTPSILGSVDTPGNANDVKVVGGLAFVADGSAGLQIIDISTPDAPFIVGSFDTPGEAWGVAVQGDTAYIADGDSGLQIIDVSNPSIPSFLGAVVTPGIANGGDGTGTRAVIAAGSGAAVVDVVGPGVERGPPELAADLRDRDDVFAGVGISLDGDGPLGQVGEPHDCFPSGQRRLRAVVTSSLSGRTW